MTPYEKWLLTDLLRKNGLRAVPASATVRRIARAPASRATVKRVPKATVRIVSKPAPKTASASKTASVPVRKQQGNAELRRLYEAWKRSGHRWSNASGTWAPMLVNAYDSEAVQRGIMDAAEGRI